MQCLQRGSRYMSASRQLPQIEVSERARLVINESDASSYGTATDNVVTSTPPSIWRRLGNGLASGCQRVAGATRYVCAHPAEAAKKTATAVLSVAAAAPNTVSAFFAPSKTDPSQVENLSTWWSGLSLGKQIHSIANGAASAVVNTIMNVLFFPAAARRLSKIIPKTFKSGRDFCRSLVSLIGGGAGATAASGIAYSAFLWLGMPFAIGAAVFNFLIYFATRFVGITNTIKKVKHFLNPDLRFQKRCVKLLNPEYKGQINDFITHYTSNPSEASFRDLFTELNKLCNERGFNNVFRKPNKKEKLKKFLGILFDILLLLPIIPSSFISFSQKGFDGIQMFDKLGGGTTIANLHIWAKRAIGFIPGLVSTIFYTATTLDLRPALVRTYDKVRRKKTRIIPVAALMGANALSGASQEGIAGAIASNPDNLYGLQPPSQSTLSQTFVGCAATGGAVTNASSNFQKYTDVPISTDVTAATDVNDTRSALDRTIEVWGRREASVPKIPEEGLPLHAATALNVPRKPNARLSHNTVEAIRRLGMFQQPQQPAPPPPPSGSDNSYQIL